MCWTVFMNGMAQIPIPRCRTGSSWTHTFRICPTSFCESRDSYMAMSTMYPKYSKKPKGTLLLWNRASSKKCLIFGWTPQNAKVVVSVPRCVQRRQSFSDLSELFFAEPSKEDHPSPLTRRSVPTVVSAPSCVRLTHLRSELTENQAFPFRNRTVSLSTI